MIIFNSLIIHKTIKLGNNINRRDLRSVKLYEKKRHLSFSLVTITFLFAVLSLPNSIVFAFYKFMFNKRPDPYLEGILNDIVFLHHSTLFLSLFLTNSYFRKAVYKFFGKKYSFQMYS
jgi:hypothetical protein